MDSENVLFTEIAQKYFDVATLEPRDSDSLDFYEVSVWSITEALRAAYNAGYSRGRETIGSRP